MRRWIVILEAMSGPSGIGIDVVRDLVAAVEALEPGALHSADRYALQLRVLAESPEEALGTALGRWREEVHRIDQGLAACSLARAEVMTPQEYELEHEADGHRESSLTPLVSHQRPDHGEELLRRALLDPLTRLPGRELFVYETERALIAGRGTDSHLAVLVINMDSVATVQQRRGSRAADVLRERVSVAIAACVRPGDTPARLDEDQIGLLLKDVSPEFVKTVAERIVEQLLDSSPLPLSVSIGVAVSTPGDGAERLVGQATAAASVARQQGGNRMAWFGGTHAGFGDERGRSEKS